MRLLMIDTLSEALSLDHHYQYLLHVSLTEA